MKPKPAAALTHNKTRLPLGPNGLIPFAAKIDIVPAEMRWVSQTVPGSLAEKTRRKHTHK